MIILMNSDMDISINTYTSVKYRTRNNCYQKVRVFEVYNDGRVPNELNNKNIDLTCDKGVFIDEDGYIIINRHNRKYGSYKFTATYKYNGETAQGEFNHIKGDIYVQ